MNKPIYKGFIDTKVIVSGDVLEAFYYKKAVKLDNRSAEENAAFALWRARVALKRLVNANSGRWFNEDTGKYYLPQFFTMTFAENIIDVQAANYEFMQFIKRFNRSILNSRKSILKYSAVIEFQERGAVHYHALLYNFPYIEGYASLLRDTWGYGRIDISSVYNVVDVGNYLTKYMVKGFSDPRLFKKKRYFNARGLIKPMVFDNSYQNGSIYDFLDQFPPHSEFCLFETDDLIYKQYILTAFNLRDIQLLPTLIPIDVKPDLMPDLSYPQLPLF